MDQKLWIKSFINFEVQENSLHLLKMELINFELQRRLEILNYKLQIDAFKQPPLSHLSFNPNTY